MKKIFKSSTTLALICLTIISVQVSCKKDSNDQSNTTQCSETATVNFTINFPTTFNPMSTMYTSNNISLSNYFSETNPHCEYFQDFRDVGSVKQKVYTFKGVNQGTYKWDASIRKNNTNTPGSFVRTAVNQINVVEGQTYNITINATDFN